MADLANDTASCSGFLPQTPRRPCAPARGSRLGKHSPEILLSMSMDQPCDPRDPDEKPGGSFER